jgi:hypothetical protein
MLRNGRMGAKRRTRRGRGDDRILIATASERAATLVTRDGEMPAYGETEYECGAALKSAAIAGGKVPRISLVLHPGYACCRKLRRNRIKGDGGLRFANPHHALVRVYH